MDLTAFRHHVFADVRFSDRGHDVSAPWNIGSTLSSGRMVRPSLSVCRINADRTLSVCNTSDAFCDSDSQLNVTGSYFNDKDLTSAATAFVNSRLFEPRLSPQNTCAPVPVAFLEDRPEVDDVRFLGSNGTAGAKMRRAEGFGGRLTDADKSSPQQPTLASTAMATRPSYTQTTWVNPEFSGVRTEQGRVGTGFASVTDTTGISSQTSLFPAPFTNSSTPISDTIAATMQPLGASGTAIGTPASLLGCVSQYLLRFVSCRKVALSRQQLWVEGP
ncbi:uncharacterized protein BROUX77_005232 [Berkeleyomyces rouxiae]|uniref:uncharacterized protein n=1 Tax=Berkeleyomyces rouxiae TaxID=2035830 RepID=UPI003B810188